MADSIYYSDGESLPPCRFGKETTTAVSMREPAAPEVRDYALRRVKLGLEVGRMWNYCAVIGAQDAGMGWPQGSDEALMRCSND